MNVATTYNESGSRPFATVPYLHPREVDGILDAIDSGELIAVAESSTTPGYSTIVALAREDLAESLTKRDDDAIKELQKALQDTRKELQSLRTIIGEVFAEKEPADWRFKLDDAADDVRKALDDADFYAREL